MTVAVEPKAASAKIPATNPFCRLDISRKIRSACDLIQASCRQAAVVKGEALNPLRSFTTNAGKIANVQSAITFRADIPYVNPMRTSTAMQLPSSGLSVQKE